MNAHARPSLQPVVRVEIAPRRGLSREEAARYIGVGATKFDEMVAGGRMPRPRRIDGRVIWDIRALDLAFDDLPGERVAEADLDRWKPAP